MERIKKLESASCDRADKSAIEGSRYRTFNHLGIGSASSGQDGRQKARHYASSSSHLGNSLGKGKQLVDKASIRHPHLLQGHSVTEQNTARCLSIEQLRELGLPTVPNPPKIDIGNLGTKIEALRSHPAVELEVNHISGDKRSKGQYRKFIVCESDNDKSFSLRGPDSLTDTLTERRPGGVFSRKDLEAKFQEFPKLETRRKKAEVKIADKAVGGPIPVLHLTPPPEGTVDQVDPTGLLSVDDAHKALLRKAEKENRSLRRLVPLAWLVAEAEGIDVNDTAALVDALAGILEDRQSLANLLPLAVRLCADQGINFDSGALKTLPGALDKILNERQRARFSAEYNEREKNRLERRVSLLETTLTNLIQHENEEEDYMR